jgi:type II secretory pathway pseudopilin PulG
MRRKGMTLVEMVVVVFLVLVMIGLLLPATQRTIPSSLRLQTNNNLKQCALAVHSFHDNYKKLPHGNGPGGIYEKNHPMWFQILPFVEANHVYTAGNLTESIASYYAPSDESNEDQAGVLSFAANVRVVGYQTFLSSSLKQAVDQPGTALETKAGPMLCGLNLGAIKDGTQNTIIFSTRYANCNGQKTWYAADALGGCELGKLPSPGVGGFMGAGSHSTPPTKDGPITAMYQLHPTALGCLPQPGVFGHSFGPHGLSVALCDGSVRNIRPDMSPLTFGRALCPGDGANHDKDWDED